MPVQGSTIDCQSLGNVICRTETGGQHYIDALAHTRAQGRRPARRKRVEILLDLLCHCRIRYRNRHIDVTGPANNAIEVLTEPNFGAEEAPMRIVKRRRRVGEANCLGFPPLAKQALKTAVQKADPQFDRLTDRYRTANIDDKIQDDEFVLLRDPEKKASLCKNI